jgi:phosphoribosyl 1,2-cyclic phosphodiesterase
MLLENLEKIRFVSLQSGSNGNCCYVGSGSTKILIDAGVGKLQVKKRLEQIGVEPSGIQAIIISHAHTDHIKHAESLRNYLNCPVWMTGQTERELNWRTSVEDVKEPVLFHPGDILMFDHLQVETIATEHDVNGGVCFVIDNGSVRLGVMTDLGHRFEALENLIPALDGIFLESNYDPELLATGKYPADLKRRIRGKRGHISNDDAFQLLQKGLNLQWACLGHISEQNNNPGRFYQLYECNGDVSACTGNCFVCKSESCVRQGKEHYLKTLSGKHIRVFYADRYGITELPAL